jgi:Ala-tRNA(Pro) deacylase
LDLPTKNNRKGISRAVSTALLKNMELHYKRPEQKRIPKEEAVYDFLQAIGAEHVRVDHEPAMNMEICDSIDGVLGSSICKNLFLCNRQETQFYLLMMPGHKTFHTKDLSAQINSSRLSFASAEWMEKLLGLTPGSVSVFGLLNDKEHRVRLLIDEELLASDSVGCHPCINTSSLRISIQELTEKILPAMNYTYTVVHL